LGGSGSDVANAVRVDDQGAIYVAGQTTSSDFPVLNAAQPRFGGTEDAFIVKYSAAISSLSYSSFIGGSGPDQAYGLDVRNGEAYLTGATSSLDFPAVNAFQSTNHGGQDAFVVKLNSSGQIAYATCLGGSGGSTGFPESGNAISVTSAGEATVAGTTSSADFPTASPIQSTLNGFESDAFVVRLNAAGNALLFGTYLGGSGADAASGVAVDSGGATYVVGSTLSTDLPLVNAVQTSNAGGYDAFLIVLDPSGASLKFATYW